jgi:hypothetical protein
MIKHIVVRFERTHPKENSSMKSLIRSLLLALALTTGAWVPVQAQTFVQSLAAYERQDYRTAFAGFKKLAAQGDVYAQFNLGNMYANGQGVPKDEQQAVVWFRKAAEQGNAMAQFNLGLMYDNGQGAPKDEQSAYFWWLLASARGNQSAVNNRDIVERRLSPAQRAAAQAAARNWQPKTAAQSSSVPGGSSAGAGGSNPTPAARPLRGPKPTAAAAAFAWRAVPLSPTTM